MKKVSKVLKVISNLFVSILPSIKKISDGDKISIPDVLILAPTVIDSIKTIFGLIESTSDNTDEDASNVSLIKKLSSLMSPLNLKDLTEAAYVYNKFFAVGATGKIIEADERDFELSLALNRMKNGNTAAEQDMFTNYLKKNGVKVDENGNNIKEELKS